MTERIGDTVVLDIEPPAPCAACGKVEELRPYGPNGERICFDCGMLDEEGTRKRMNELLFGEFN